jgi:hypothetical protein
MIGYLSQGLSSINVQCSQPSGNVWLDSLREENGVAL